MVHHTLHVTKNLRYSACFNTFILVKIVFSNVYLHREHIIDINVFFLTCYLCYCPFTGQIWNLKTWSSAGLFSFWPLFTYTLTLLHPNISMHILHTVLYTFPMVLVRRICLPIKSFFSWWSFPLFSWPWCVIQGWYCKENLDCSHSQAKGSFVWQCAL